jgi:transmembrane sensor
VGEIRRVPLSDGSMAAINTDTVLDVAMRPRCGR